MSLKEQIEGDIFGVFLNPKDFGDFHTVNGSRVMCLVDKDNVHMRSGGGRRTEGVREGSFFLYIAAAEFRVKPKAHDPIEVNGGKYFIRNVSDEEGMLVIEYGGVSDGIRRAVGRSGAD